MNWSISNLFWLASRVMRPLAALLMDRWLLAFIANEPEHRLQYIEDHSAFSRHGTIKLFLFVEPTK